MIVTRQGSDLVFRVTGPWVGQTCCKTVTGVLRLSDKECTEAFRQGLVRVGSKLAQANDILRAGDTLRAKLAIGPREAGALKHEPAPWNTELAVLYEDDHMLVVEKPAGVIMYPDGDGERETLASAVAHYYDVTGQDVWVRAVHRLDRDTTGACLYAKHAGALRILDAALQAREIRREYLAIVRGVPPVRHGTIAKALGRDRHVAGKMRLHSGGQPAVTHYEVLWQGERHALLRCELDTGRTHQIRVHLSSVGLPLLGDLLYGLSSPVIDRQALHAFRLTCHGPYDKEEIQVTAPLPQDMRSACEQIGASAALSHHVVRVD